MTKDIKDLITDIYKLFDGHECNEKHLETFGKELANVIGNRLHESRDGKANTLRMSNIGKPDRQLWYDINNNEGSEKLAPHTRLKFLIGDVWEAVLLFLAEEAGHEVTHKQERVELNGVVGHLDAKIDGVTVDVKSASTYSFQKFKSGELRNQDPFGYIEQTAGYATTQGTSGAFLAGDKTLGHLTLMEIPKEEITAIHIEDRIEHIKAVVASPELPGRCYAPKEDGKSGNLVLDTGCSYCSHKFKCWADANGGLGIRTFLFSSGPKHFTRVVVEPRVLEVTF